MDISTLIGREEDIFAKDIGGWEMELQAKVTGSTFLVIGGAGYIGQAVTKEIFNRKPKKLHIADISENNLCGVCSGYSEFNGIY